MKDRNYTIWIEAEEWEHGEWDSLNDNSDVIVEFDSGERWVASFFSYANVMSLVEKNRSTGENLDGKYFWSSDMILVDEISRNRIEEVIHYLLNEDTFQIIFSKCKC